MRVITVNNPKPKNTVKLKGVTYWIKRFLLILKETELIDVDAILESKDWPYLWRK